MTIRRSKTDQEGAGEVAPITPDAMRHVRAWIDAAGIAGALDAGDVARIFKAMAGKAGLNGRGSRADQRPFNAHRRLAN